MRAHRPSPSRETRAPERCTGRTTGERKTGGGAGAVEKVEKGAARGGKRPKRERERNKNKKGTGREPTIEI